MTRPSAIARNCMMCNGQDNEYQKIIMSKRENVLFLTRKNQVVGCL